MTLTLTDWISHNGAWWTKGRNWWMIFSFRWFKWKIYFSPELWHFRQLEVGAKKEDFSREIIPHLGSVLIVYASKWHAATTFSVNQNGHGLSWTIIDVQFLNQNKIIWTYLNLYHHCIMGPLCMKPHFAFLKKFSINFG